jgi:hypothetical protein
MIERAGIACVGLNDDAEIAARLEMARVLELTLADRLSWPIDVVRRELQISDSLAAEVFRVGNSVPWHKRH